MVIDPIELVEEINMLKEKDISIEKVLISPNAHIVTPLHKLLDRKNDRDLSLERRYYQNKHRLTPCQQPR